jgi:hypothetical protein
MTGFHDPFFADAAELLYPATATRAPTLKGGSKYSADLYATV